MSVFIQVQFVHFIRESDKYSVGLFLFLEVYAQKQPREPTNAQAFIKPKSTLSPQKWSSSLSTVCICFYQTTCSRVLTESTRNSCFRLSFPKRRKTNEPTPRPAQPRPNCEAPESMMDTNFDHQPEMPYALVSVQWVAHVVGRNVLRLLLFLHDYRGWCTTRSVVALGSRQRRIR